MYLRFDGLKTEFNAVSVKIYQRGLGYKTYPRKGGSRQAQYNDERFCFLYKAF